MNTTTVRTNGFWKTIVMQVVAAGCIGFTFMPLAANAQTHWTDLRDRMRMLEAKILVEMNTENVLLYTREYEEAWQGLTSELEKEMTGLDCDALFERLRNRLRLSKRQHDTISRCHRSLTTLRNEDRRRIRLLEHAAPVEHRKASVDNRFTISLPNKTRSGFVWELSFDRKFLKLESNRYVQSNASLGTERQEVYTFLPFRMGTTEIVVRSVRPSDRERSLDTRSFIIDIGS